MAPTEKLLTAEEFEQVRADGKRYELIDGELREMPPTVNWHGEVESKLVVRVGLHVETHRLGIVSCGESLYIVHRNPDRVRAADIAFLPQDRVPSLEARHAVLGELVDFPRSTPWTRARQGCQETRARTTGNLLPLPRTCRRLQAVADGHPATHAPPL